MSKVLIARLRAQSLLRPANIRMNPSVLLSSQQDYSTHQQPPPQADPATLLSKPTWSVRSLLPAENQETSEATQITPKQLHHLLRLSALPLPKTPEEEAEMINVLQSQLSFVRDIQSVDTEGIEPLRSIRDETDEGMSEATIGVEQLRQALSEEVFSGRTRRPRRQNMTSGKSEEDVRTEGWDPLETAAKRAGRFFVVQSKARKLST